MKKQCKEVKCKDTKLYRRKTLVKTLGLLAISKTLIFRSQNFMLYTLVLDLIENLKDRFSRGLHVLFFTVESEKLTPRVNTQSCHKIVVIKVLL